MSYQHERDEFISRAVREGLSLDVCRKLLRYATTLQRLAEAQCNGDWPYNGDRDRPLPRTEKTDRFDRLYAVCPKCEASGVARSAMRTSSHVRTTPSGVRTTEDKLGNLAKVCPDCRTQELVQDLVREESEKFNACPYCSSDLQTSDVGKLQGHNPKCPCAGSGVNPFEYDDDPVFKPIFQGDPRGAVLVLSTPGYPWTEDGRGRGLYVPARTR